MLKPFPLVLLLLLVLAVSAGAAGPVAKKPAGSDKCPVCGMFVAKYPDFAAQIQFNNGSVSHFDGAKDLFKYYLDSARYTAGRKSGEVAAIFVNSYYSLTPIDAHSAWFVIGSDVFGPMGRELIPFAKESEAREFMTDHKGKKMLRFRDITPAIIKGLD